MPSSMATYRRSQLFFNTSGAMTSESFDQVPRCCSATRDADTGTHFDEAIRDGCAVRQLHRALDEIDSGRHDRREVVRVG